MTQEKFNTIKLEILDIVKYSPISTDITHAKGTLKWLLMFNPNADYILQIAALGHDIERGTSAITIYYGLPNSKEYEVNKVAHTKKSAEILSETLKNNDVDMKDNLRVQDLVIKHEIGGNPDAELIMNADSASFFEDNLVAYFVRNGEEKTRQKIKYMFNRIHDNKVKQEIRNIKHSDEELNTIVESII